MKIAEKPTVLSLPDQSWLRLFLFPVFQISVAILDAMNSFDPKVRNPESGDVVHGGKKWRVDRKERNYSFENKLKFWDHRRSCP